MKLKTSLIVAAGLLFTGSVYWGCVEIPSEGLPVPDYVSQFRFIYADPALPTSTVSMASGLSFTTYVDVNSGTFATSSAYMNITSGAKRAYVHVGGVPVDPETTSLSLAADERGTIVVVPRNATDKIRFVKISERYLFGSVGKADSALVRVVNAVASMDTIDVVQLSPGGTSSVAINDLRPGRVGSSLIRVPRDSTRSFFITRYNSTSAAGTDTVTIVGASNKVYTIVAHDSLSQASFVSFEEQ